MQLSNLSIKDITLVPLEVDEHEKAFDEDRIDLVVTFEPVRSKLLSKGAHILFDSTEIPNEIVDVLIVRSQYVETAPQLLEHIVASWYKALSFLEKSPRQAAEIMKERLGVSADEVIKSYDGIVLPDRKTTFDLLSGQTPSSLSSSSKKLAETMYELKLLKTRIDTSTLFDSSIIQAVQ
jgi:NitT/TauT family transport system substrate-binding protein